MGPGLASGQGQGTLFDGDADLGYRGPTACSAAGITYRQLDYWARTGLVEPSVRAAHGSGSQRLYSFRDILVLKVVKRLLDTGISLQQIRAAVQHLRDHGSEDLAQVTLMSDGVSVYECTSPDEVVDLLAGGQGVFGIALGRVWQEVAGELAEMPAVRAEDGLIVTGDPDELVPPRGRTTGIDRAVHLAAARLTDRRATNGVRLSAALQPVIPIRERPRASPHHGGRRRGKFPQNLSGTKDQAGQATLEPDRVTDGEPMTGEAPMTG